MPKYVPNITPGRMTVAPDWVVKRLAEAGVTALTVQLADGQTAPDFESAPEGAIYGPAQVRYSKRPDGGITQEIVWKEPEQTR